MMMGGGFGFGMVLFWGLIIVAVVLLARAFYGTQERGSQKSARQVLDERYARGEIGKQEYEERKQALR
jgi:putative membrane protein